jgi:peptidoglycan/LPS O-acetylase OafA/YrhL
LKEISYTLYIYMIILTSVLANTKQFSNMCRINLKLNILLSLPLGLWSWGLVTEAARILNNCSRNHEFYFRFQRERTRQRVLSLMIIFQAIPVLRLWRKLMHGTACFGPDRRHF